MELVVQFPARGSTQVLLCLFPGGCGCDTSYIVSVHIQFQATINILSLCRGHSWRVRLAKQETLTPPGHLVSPLVCRDPWMFTVVLYYWCHSDSASVLLYFTLLWRNHIHIHRENNERIPRIFFKKCLKHEQKGYSWNYRYIENMTFEWKVQYTSIFKNIPYIFVHQAIYFIKKIYGIHS